MAKRRPKPSKKELQSSYKELRSTRKVAKQCGVSHRTIIRWMDNYSIERLSASEANLTKKLPIPLKKNLKVHTMN